jgi:hypothetical protein
MSVAAEVSEVQAPEPERLWSHQFLDTLSLAYCQEIARRVQSKPELIETAQSTITRWLTRNDYSDAQKRALGEWQAALRVDRMDALLEMMQDPGPEGVRRRQSSPFAGVLELSERRRIKETVKHAWRTQETIATH